MLQFIILIIELIVIIIQTNPNRKVQAGSY